MKAYLIATLTVSSLMNPALAYISTPESACTAVDLRNEFMLKMRNQGEISWCYAHAAADYLQYTFRLPEPISAADIAILYAGTNPSKIVSFFRKIFSKDARKEPPQTGFIKKAINTTLKEGYCPEWALPSERWIKVHQNGNRQSVELIDAILEMYSLQSAVHEGKHPRPETLPWHYEFEHLGKTQFHSLLRDTSKRELLQGLRKIACSGERKPYPLSPIKSCFKLKGRKIFQRINTQISSRMPVSVDFFSGVLTDLDGAKRKIEDLHTVLLYGRKYDSKSQECVYLMKNSYGADCSIYDPKIKCEAGYLWMPESKIHPHLTSLLSITRQ